MIENLINHFDINFIMPISKIDENMDTAHKMDSLIKDKFWFRTKHLFPNDLKFDPNLGPKICKNSKLYLDEDSKDQKKEREIDEENYELLYIHEILLGKKESNFIGLYPIIQIFMKEMGYSNEDIHKINHHLDFLKERSLGEIKTGARFTRDLVLNHPDYKQDSIVNEKVAYSILKDLVAVNDKNNHFMRT